MRLPAPRSGLAETPAADDTLVVEDPITGHRTHLGRESAAVWRALAAGPQNPAALCAAASDLPPPVVRERLRQIRDALLLDDARWRAQAPLFETPPPPPIAELPVKLDPALRHRCVRCGSSCLAVDIGPIAPPTLAAVERHRLWIGTPDAESAAETVQRRITEQGPVEVFTHVDGACVMLRDGDACAIQAAAGAEAKPAGCRQFPYTLTAAEDGLHVGLQLECRSLVDAAHAGAAVPTEAIAEALRALALDDGFVSRLPDPVTIGPGLFVPAARYRAWHADATAALAAVLDAGEPPHPRLLAASAIALAEARAAELGPPPDWLDPAAWPGAPAPKPRAADLRRALPEQVMGACAWLTRDAAGRRDLVEQEQAELVRKAALVHTGAVRLPPTHRAPTDGPDPLRIALAGALADHRAVLGIDLLQGLGRLALWFDLSLALARLRAAQAARRPVRPDDVNDALLIAHRVLRTGVVDHTLRAAHAAVRAGLRSRGGYADWMGVPAPGLLDGGAVTAR